MSNKLKEFIKSKGFTDSEIKQLRDWQIKDLQFEYNYLKRIGVK